MAVAGYSRERSGNLEKSIPAKVHVTSPVSVQFICMGIARDGDGCSPGIDFKWTGCPVSLLSRLPLDRSNSKSRKRPYENFSLIANVRKPSLPTKSNGGWEPCLRKTKRGRDFSLHHPKTRNGATVAEHVVSIGRPNGLTSRIHQFCQSNISSFEQNNFTRKIWMESRLGLFITSCIELYFACVKYHVRRVFFVIVDRKCLWKFVFLQK